MIRAHKTAVVLSVTGLVLLVGLGSWALWAGCGACSVGTATPEKHSDAKAEPVAESAEVSTAALKTLINAKVPMVILDARGAQPTRIPGAVAMSAKAEKDAVKKAVPSTDTLVVTYCGSKTCPLSSMLAKRLRAMGYKNVLEYTVGIKGWTESGGEVEKAG